MKTRVSAWVAVLVMGMVTASMAQEVVLVDGTKIRWKTIADREDALMVRTTDDKIVTVKKTDIARITKGASEKPVVLTGATATFTQKTVRVNLLGKLDTKRDAFTGEWRFGGGALTTRTDGTQNARIMVGEAPAEYDLTVAVERLSGKQWFGVILVGGGRQFMYMLDSGGNRSGIWLLEGRTVAQHQGDAVKMGVVFERRRARVATFKVRKEGFVVQLDGKDYHGWTGDWKKLSLAPQHQIPRKGALAVVNGGDEWRIRGLTLTVPKE